MNKQTCINTAKFIIESNPLFFDTETTGIDAKDQMVSISVLDTDEHLVYDRFFIPTVDISPAAAAVHGITLEFLAKNGLYFTKEFYNVKNLFDGRVVVAYNTMFDVRIINQTLMATGFNYPSITPMIAFDAMLLYSHYAGVPGYRGSFKWFKLREALEREAVEVSDLKFHDSSDDVRGMIRLVKHLACQVCE
jgi:DNA polymerase-3 subunit epsilon